MNNRFRWILEVAAAFSLLGSPTAGAAVFRVLVVAGQSNAVGNGVRPTDLEYQPVLKVQDDILLNRDTQTLRPIATNKNRPKGRVFYP